MSARSNRPASVPSAPVSLRALQDRIRNVAAARQQSYGRTQVTVGQVVVAHMLPAGAVKGGAGLKFRLGDAFTRDSSDLDTAFRGEFQQFVDDLRAALQRGWGGFTGALQQQAPRQPAGVPAAYVMQPFKVKLRFRNKPFMTVDLEVGYDELDSLSGPVERILAEDVSAHFRQLGLETPSPVPVYPLPVQIAQKLHACSEPGSDRAHDLVDLQLLAPDAENVEVAESARRVFVSRKAHPWPPAVSVGESWDTLYVDAAQDLPVLPTAAEAVAWVNAYIARLDQLAA